MSCAAVAQPAASNPSASRTVNLVTFGPGEEIYEKFAHNAIWIHDPAAPPGYQDPCFNFGLFNFSNDFLLRFAMGSMRYSMAPFDAYESFDDYRAQNRDIYTQELRFTPAQAQALNDALWINYRPENREYIYDYYRANCSTQVRDALDRALDGQIKKQTQNVPTGHTFRFHTRRILASNPLFYVCTDFVLGHPVDRPLSRWGEMFLPMLMRQYLRDVTVTNATGRAVPLVVSEQTIFRGTRPAVRDEPPHWTIYFILAGVLTAGLMLVLYRYSARSRFARWTLATLIYAWTLLTAVAGGSLAFFNCFSTHHATYYNENILQMPPIALLTLFLLTFRRFILHPSSFILSALYVLTFACSAVGLVMKILPIFRQDNWDLIYWILPIHAAVAIIFVLKSRRAAPEPIKENA